MKLEAAIVNPHAGPPKKRKNGRRKGKQGEREVAAMCAAWWSALEPGCEFRSTPSSGGWATPQLRGHFKVAGDLTTTAKKWPFTVEVKRREKWDLSNLYAARPSPVWGWWAQACKAAVEEGRAPILFLRKGKPGSTPEWFVMLPQFFAKLLPRLDSALLRPQVVVQPMLTTWDAVLRCATPSAIIRLCREYALQGGLAAPQLSPHPNPTSAPKRPRKLRQRPAQAGASLPLDQHPNPEFRKNAMLRELALLPKRFAATQLQKTKRSRS